MNVTIHGTTYRAEGYFRLVLFLIASLALKALRKAA
jgi:hypothetical protein